MVGHVRSTGNSVTVRNSALTAGTIRGATLNFAKIKGTVEGQTTPLDYQLTGNSVTLEHSKLAVDSIFGRIAGTVSKPEWATITGNTVTIGEGVRALDGGVLTVTHLYRGFAKDMSTAVEGNTLNLKSPVVAENFGGFQNLNFHLPDGADRSDGGAAPLLTVRGTALIGRSGSAAARISVSGGALGAGERFTLISAAGGFVDETNTPWSADDDSINEHKTALEATERLSYARTTSTSLAPDDYTLSIEGEPAANGSGQDLVVQITGTTPPDPGPGTDPEEPKPPVWNDSVDSETNALMQSSLSAYGTMIEAGDLFVDTVMRASDGRREGLFVAARAGTYSYDKSQRGESTIVTGLIGYGLTLGTSGTEVGGFIEMGHASYDTTTPTAAGRVEGDGTHNYAGAGLYVNQALPVEGLRMTAYVKAGAMANDFDTTLAGKKVPFDRTSAYWGAHLGMNYDWSVTQKLTGRAFVNYFYDGREKETYRMAGTDTVAASTFTYDALEGHRVQVGNLFTYAYSENLKPYFGLTVEDIVKAEATGSADDVYGNLKLNAADMEGFTGILSAGWTYVNDAKDFEFGAGVNAYAGMRNGVDGTVQAKWAF